METNPSVLDQIAERLHGALIALDFDGTLAPIVDVPSDARPTEGVIETLHELGVRGAQVAIVTGRDALTVLQLGQLHDVPGLRVHGLYGAEVWQDGQLRTRDEPAGILTIRKELPPLIEPFDGVWIEDKRLSLVVHTRRAVEPKVALQQLRPAIGELAARHNLEMHEGKQVIEIRIGNISKADAVLALLDLDPPAALFAGDDLGDLPAFEVVNAWSERTGRPSTTIAVGEEQAVQSCAKQHVATPSQLAAVLAGLLK